MEIYNANCDSEIMSKIFSEKPKWKTLFLICLYIKTLFYLSTKNTCTEIMRIPINRRTSHSQGGKWKKIGRILKVFRKWKRTWYIVARTTYRIESMLSSFVPWLFHNRLWYNSACSCIPYVYAPATPTSGRVNTISRYAHVAHLVWRIYHAICLLVTLEIHRVSTGLYFILKWKFLSSF